MTTNFNAGRLQERADLRHPLRPTAYSEVASVVQVAATGPQNLRPLGGHDSRSFIDELERLRIPYPKELDRLVRDQEARQRGEGPVNKTAQARADSTALYVLAQVLVAHYGTEWLGNLNGSALTSTLLSKMPLQGLRPVDRATLHKYLEQAAEVMNDKVPSLAGLGD